MINETNVFDIYDVIVNELVGDVWLTVILGLLVVLIIAIKSNIPYQVSILFGLIWMIVMFSETNFMIIWVYVVLFAGTFFYYSLSRAFKKG